MLQPLTTNGTNAILEIKGSLCTCTPCSVYSAVRMKPNKKYLNFFWVFPQITRVMRSLSIKNYCRNASKNEKITIF